MRVLCARSRDRYIRCGKQGSGMSGAKMFARCVDHADVVDPPRCAECDLADLRRATAAVESHAVFAELEPDGTPGAVWRETDVVTAVDQILARVGLADDGREVSAAFRETLSGHPAGFIVAAGTEAQRQYWAWLVDECPRELIIPHAARMGHIVRTMRELLNQEPGAREPLEGSEPTS